jgi:hypothetical protein
MYWPWTSEHLRFSREVGDKPLPTSDHERMDIEGHDDRHVEGAVSKPAGLEQTQWRPDFYLLCKIHSLSYDDLLFIAEQAGVPKEVVHRMFLKYPVKFSEAVAVLKAFSYHVGRNWTMENTRVPVTTKSPCPLPPKRQKPQRD